MKKTRPITPIVTKFLSGKYLQSCRDRAHSADPTGYDTVIKDLRRKMNRLVTHIEYMQSEIRKAANV